MILTIWRHGEAGSAASDRERSLTEQGRADIRHAGPLFRTACAARELPSPSSILFSPWRRTSETAALISAALPQASLAECAALRPGADEHGADRAVQEVAGTGSQTHILLVSHQPLVSRLVDFYLGERGLLPPLSPGGLATLSMDWPGPGLGSPLFCALPPLYEVGL